MSHPFEPRSSQPSSYDYSIISSVGSPVFCYFIVADMLGFSRMIGNLKGDEIAQ